jgi:LPS export ABC transporter protein LptC
LWGVSHLKSLGRSGKIIAIIALASALSGLLFWIFQPKKSALKSGSGGDAGLLDPSLKLDDLVLEQADDQGNLLWKLKAKKATYNRDKKEGEIIDLSGELYQDGKPAFKISAKKGEIIGDGKVMLLKENIVAVAIKDGVEFKGNEMEWKPKDDQLSIKNKFTAVHKQVKVAATGGQYFSRKRQADLVGAIVAEVKDPKLKLQTEKLTWLLEPQTIDSQAPVTIERTVEKVVTDRATAAKGSYDLKSNVAKLTTDVKISVANPDVKITGEELTWDTKKQLVTAPKPFSAFSAAEQVTMSSDRGEFKLKEKIGYLTQNVKGARASNQATIATDKLTWFLEPQTFEAEGNIVYRSANPAANLVGKTAKGNLTTQQVTVTGGNEADDRVIIDIDPGNIKLP